ncbi:glycerate dehydrogenase [Sediminibacillus dalangtanensis]|uniref:Glycerate dehydrogenase n=1 Tax=Sediminibacillus dalangtanensis TaxID=2729421 RepID=A0ABX7VQ43_9BACI|nr:hydroxyacid dehydrogenase [Sediminibacillus dalangtanensis]QTM99021.1 glycerate dehydrogenase [Sediminibacillus dalangtanensis]
MEKGLFIMRLEPFDYVYPPAVREEISQFIDILAPPMAAETARLHPELLRQADVIFSGWSGPRLDESFLETAEKLKVFFYAAGSVKPIVTDAVWKRKVKVTSAIGANAIPVVEFTLSQVLFCLKNGWQFVRQVKRERQFPEKPFPIAGSFQSTVGLISLSTVGRGVAEQLKRFDVEVLAYDPFVNKKEAEKLGVTLCSLKQIFQQSDVVSLHAPLLDDTRGMITGEHFAIMKQHASFINTARGAIIREPEMVRVLTERTDITAVLDVTDPEPPAVGSPLYQMENVVLTPHLAGSEGAECGRMGMYMLEELKRYVAGETLKWQVNPENLHFRA